MRVEVETTIEITVKVSGNYTPGAKPLPVRGEAVAVECPGWEEGVDDVEVEIVGKDDERDTVLTWRITKALDAEAIETLEHELIAAARDD